MLKDRASRERGVRFKLFEQRHFLHLHLREVVPAMFHRILFAQIYTASTWLPGMNKSEARLSSGDTREVSSHTAK